MPPKVVQFDGMPSMINYNAIIESMLGKQFLLWHNLRRCDTLLITNDDTAKLGRIAGVSFHDADPASLQAGGLRCFVVYNSLPERMQERSPQALGELYRLFGGDDIDVVVSFAPSDPAHIKRIRQKIEERVSSKEVRLTRPLGGGIRSPQGSLQMDVYHGSDEKRIMLSMLDMLGEAAMGNETSYKVCVIVRNAGEQIRSYLRSRLYVLDEFALRATDIPSLLAEVDRTDAVPLSYGHASNMLSFSSSIKRAEVMDSAYWKSTGAILIGEYMDGGVRPNGGYVHVDKTAFNLGTIITGLPGTGKTMSAMHLVGQLSGLCRKGSVIISPTEEWDSFGQHNGMRVLRLYEPGTHMNFFKCDADINIERFYENLAILLASASNAGPYRNSLEKSLLAAFHKVYHSTRCPDPADVYSEIERAVIDQHAKRTNTDVTYTKHGENVMAALESLRLMLLKPQFSYAEGINFVDAIRNGAVFDLSLVSNNIKPFFYALILNQLYGIADSLDIYGDSELRMLICLEEAQLVFGNIEESAATHDLKQRIQDFRKKGVGLIMITHNITDINLGIRRLCQMKLYFRQSSDVAKYACADLVFPADYQDVIIDKMKTLGHGVCALSYVSTNGPEKSLEGSVFAKMPQPEPLQEYVAGKPPGRDELLVGTTIMLQASDGKPLEGVHIELLYLGERLYDGVTGTGGIVTIEDTLKGKQYLLLVRGEKKRDTRRFKIVGGTEARLTIV